MHQLEELEVRLGSVRQGQPWDAKASKCIIIVCLITHTHKPAHKHHVLSVAFSQLPFSEPLQQGPRAHVVGHNEQQFTKAIRIGLLSTGTIAPQQLNAGVQRRVRIMDHALAAGGRRRCSGAA